jgi:hypothetical protein
MKQKIMVLALFLLVLGSVNAEGLQEQIEEEFGVAENESEPEDGVLNVVKSMTGLVGMLVDEAFDFLNKSMGWVSSAVANLIQISQGHAAVLIFGIILVTMAYKIEVVASLFEALLRGPTRIIIYVLAIILIFYGITGGFSFIRF